MDDFQASIPAKLKSSHIDRAATFYEMVLTSRIEGYKRFVYVSQANIENILENFKKLKHDENVQTFIFPYSFKGVDLIMNWSTDPTSFTID